MKNDKNKKEEKKKVVYVDDGSQIADMSQLEKYGMMPRGGSNSTFKEKWQTYFRTVKLMIIPMLVTIGIITAAYLLLYILLSLA